MLKTIAYFILGFFLVKSLPLKNSNTSISQDHIATKDTPIQDSLALVVWPYGPKGGDSPSDIAIDNDGNVENVACGLE